MMRLLNSGPLPGSYTISVSQAGFVRLQIAGTEMEKQRLSTFFW
jgi:hypothetical protein